MPRPKKLKGKRRGPRQERKRRQAAKAEQERKRPKLENGKDVDDAENEAASAKREENKPMAFYGMLNKEEQDYFTKADEVLELNQFNSAEDRELFIANVLREANGKQLKIACSQSCSRLMERLIVNSSQSQLKDLFSAFNGHFLNLVQHRFGSHCCEALFLQAGPVVTEELTAPLSVPAAGVDGEVFVSIENLFLYAVHELDGNYGYLVTDRYASHTLRVLIMILAGLPSAKLPTKSLLRGKSRKEATIDDMPSFLSGDSHPRRQAFPDSFATAVDKILSDIVTVLSPTELRALATHPTGNPLLQLIVELESMEPWKSQTTAERSVLRKLLAEDSDQGLGYASFITGLLYDPVGSHLLEAIVRFAPGKTFKSIYRHVLRDRIADAVKNNVANFVAIRVLERLGKDDLQNAMDLILPHLKLLVGRSRHAVIKTIIDRCVARELDLGIIAKAIEGAYQGLSPSVRLQQLLQWEDVPGKDEGTVEGKPTARATGRVHGSLLAQTMLAQSGPISSLISEGLLDTPPSTLTSMAEDPAASRLLQIALGLPNLTAVFRRRFIGLLLDHVARLAVHPIGWHLVDALWTGTRGLQHYRERVAQTLSESESALKSSPCGRTVWGNWKMNVFNNRRERWIALCKASDSSSDGKSRTGV